MSVVQEHGSPYESWTIDELRATEVSLLKEKGAREALADDEYERHYEYIRRVRRSEPSTHKLYTKKSVYSSERQKAHEELIEELLSRYEHFSRAQEAILIGGMPGAGKTSLVRSLGYSSENYADANPDLLKDSLVERALEPKIPGLLPLETDELIRYEAGILDKTLVEKLTARGTNLMIDRTLVSYGSIVKLVEELKARGYKTIHGYFVDIEPELAYERTRARHRLGLDNFLIHGEGRGERPVPGSAIKASRPGEDSLYRTANAEVFSRLVSEGAFTGEARVFDGKGLREVELNAFLSSGSVEI